MLENVEDEVNLASDKKEIISDKPSKLVLVAGANGYVGQNVVRALKQKGFRIRALVRSEKKLEPVKSLIDEVVVGDVTFESSLKDCCKDVTVIISCIGVKKGKKPGKRFSNRFVNHTRRLLGSGPSRKFEHH